MQNNNNNNNNNKANTKNETNKIMQIICKNVTCYSYDRATDKDMEI